MAFSYTGGVHNSGLGTAITTTTHGITINEGDLVVTASMANGSTNITADDAGWTTGVDEEPAGITARAVYFWRVAGASEPTAYTFTISGSTDWGLVMGVWSSSSDAEIDAAANTDLQVSSAQDMIIGAIDGEVIANDAVSIAVGMKDGRAGSSEAYTTADNSYTGVEGDVTNQAICMAHRIYTTGTTFSGDVTVETADSNDGVNDPTYSVHMSFVESGGGGGGSALPLLNAYYHG